MRFITDLHIHSRYSRACSPALTLPNIDAWAAAKGIDIIATGDFTHPAWLKEVERCLEPAEDGLFRLRPSVASEAAKTGAEAAPPSRGSRPGRFVLSTELSCIYKKNGQTRRLHLVLLMPSLAAVKRLVAALEQRQINLKSDGRPILGMDAKELLKISLDADAAAEMIPAHAWTPWFAVFGSQSGFDSLSECFEEMTPHIHAIETGLSSDPPMNWRISALDQVALVSNSDAHGLRNLGREANVFDFPEPSYSALTGALLPAGRKNFLYTIEFYPEEGKYHADGHADCHFSCEPAETKRLGGRCPKCGKLLTRGVLGRVDALADRPVGAGGERRIPFRSIVPLEETVAAALGKGKASKAVGQVYRRLLEAVAPEFDILLDAPLEEIAAVDQAVAEAVRRVRAGEVAVQAGYDGLFGEVKIFFEPPQRPKQGSLGL